MRCRDDHARRRVIRIAADMVSSQVERGELDPADDASMDKAIKQAVRDAHAQRVAQHERR